MAIDNYSQNQIELLKAILSELNNIKSLLETNTKIQLRESKQTLKEAREHRKKMLLEAKKLLESPNREAMILEELKKYQQR